MQSRWRLCLLFSCALYHGIVAQHQLQAKAEGSGSLMRRETISEHFEGGRGRGPPGRGTGPASQAAGKGRGKGAPVVARPPNSIEDVPETLNREVPFQVKKFSESDAPDVDGQFGLQSLGSASKAFESRKRSQVNVSRLRFGTSLGYMVNFTQSAADARGWAKVAPGTVIQGLKFSTTYLDIALYTNLRDDTPDAQKHDLTSDERYADLDCVSERWNWTGGGLRQCTEGHFLAGFFSRCASPFPNIALRSRSDDLYCISHARCCKPRGIAERWGACTSWEFAQLQRDDVMHQSAVCQSKYQAAVGIQSVLCNSSNTEPDADMCFAGLKCCEPPQVAVCGECVGDLPFAKDHQPRFCKGETCDAEECCESQAARDEREAKRKAMREKLTIKLQQKSKGSSKGKGKGSGKAIGKGITAEEGAQPKAAPTVKQGKMRGAVRRRRGQIERHPVSNNAFNFNAAAGGGAGKGAGTGAVPGLRAAKSKAPPGLPPLGNYKSGR